MNIRRKILLSDIIILAYLFAAIVADEGALIMKIMRVCLFVLTAITIVRRKRVFFNSYVVWLLLFLTFSCCSIWWSLDKNYAFAMVKTLLFSALCMYSLLYLIKIEPQRKELVFKSLIYFPLILEARVILSDGLFAFINSRNASGINGNIVGLCAALGACFAYYMYLESRNKKYIITFMLNISVMILSSSRKAILCFIIPAVFTFLYQQKRNVSKKMLKVIGIVVAALIGVYMLINVPILYNTVGNRIVSMLANFMGQSNLVDASTRTRTNLITWGLEWFSQKKWLGWGIDNYRVVLHAYHPDYPMSFYAHNNYVELLVDVGIIGTCIYYYIYILCLKNSIKERKKLDRCQTMFVGIIIALLISEIGLVSYYDKYFQIILLLSWLVLVNKQASVRDRKGSYE